MQTLGLNAAEFDAFTRALRGTHERHIEVRVMNLSGDVLSTATRTATLLDGQVVIEGGAEVSRSASLSLLDPAQSLGFDTDSPDDGALYLDRMVNILYGIYVVELTRWVDVEIFTGPITSLERNGVTVSIEAQGKESLALPGIWQPLTLFKGMRKVDAIRSLMGTRAGEADFSFPNATGRLPAELSFDRDASAWVESQKLARSMTRQLFYDGRGVCTLRTLPGNPLHVFRGGDGGDLLTNPAVSYTSSELANVVKVVGGKPKDKRRPRPSAVARAPRTHPLSPERLARNGVARVIPLLIEDDQIGSIAEARNRAQGELEELLRLGVAVTFDALPLPHLDPGDLVDVETDSGTLRFRVNAFTIPLGAGPMSVGYTKRATPRRDRIR